MNKKIYIPTLIVILMMVFLSALQPATVQAQTGQATSAARGELDDSAELEAFLDDYLAGQMETYHIPGVVITFVKDGEVFLSKSYGYADLEQQIPMDVEDTLLTNASLGKVFAAVGVLQQYERGVIDLHEDVRQYFTDFSLETNFDEPLTFANLLTHTDGFEARMIGVAALDEESLLSLGEFVEAYTPTQLYSPGQYMTYGDFAATLNGYLTQQVSGVPFETYMVENIFAPLGMTSSTFNQRLSAEQIESLALGYDYADGEYHAAPFFYIHSGPAGGLRTTAGDMNAFMLALLNGGEYNGARILNEETMQLMYAQKFAPHPKMAGITYGLFEHFENGQRILLRDGDGVGTRSRMVLIPEQDLGFFVSYNSDDSNLRLELVHAFLDRYYPVDSNATPLPLADHQTRTKLFAGTYRPLQADITTFGKSMYFFSQLVEVSSTKEGYLSVVTAGMGGEQSSVMGGFEGTSLWIEIEPLYFEQVGGKGQLAFVQDESGEIVQMISGQGYHSTFAKLPWYESQGFQMLLVELVALLLISATLSTFAGWPLSALLRKVRKSVATEAFSWGAFVARLWMGIVATMLGLFIFQTIGVLYAIDAVAGFPNFVWGISDGMVSALNSIYLPTLLALPLPIFTALAWGNYWWKTSARIHYTLVTLAVMGAIWWANYSNLLGFRF